MRGDWRSRIAVAPIYNLQTPSFMDLLLLLYYANAIIILLWCRLAIIISVMDDSEFYLLSMLKLYGDAGDS